MRTLLSFAHVTWLTVLLAFAGSLGAGCRSTPKVNWDSRVGNYTYDQAVQELGPPDKTATLSDGKKVADWVQRSRGGGLSFGLGTGFSTGHTGVGVGQSIGTRSSDRVLRLTFDPENKLVSWSKNY
jgi:hypothetical protein